MAGFENLEIYAHAHQLALAVYTATRCLPAEERFALTDQMRRAAVSIAANIAEGKGRGSDREFAAFLRIASGSCSELQAQALIARDLHYLSQEVAADLLQRSSALCRMLGAFRARLERT